MRRGDIVTVAPPGDFGKPRPALVVQSDLFNETHPSLTLCLITSDLRDTPVFRITVDPTPANGLRRLSQIQVDKMFTALRQKIGASIGRLEDETMVRVNRAVAVWLGIA